MATRKSKEHSTDDQAASKRSSAKQKQQTPNALGNKGNTMSDMSIIEYAEDLGEATAPVPLPKGDYPAEITAVERKTSGAGNEYINVTFRIDADNYPADYTEGNEEGTILSYGRLSPDTTQRARWGMKKFCEAIGAKLGKQLDLNDWIGLNAIVTIDHQTYEGEDRATIKKVNPA
jgi:hypothetical protein